MFRILGSFVKGMLGAAWFFISLFLYLIGVLMFFYILAKIF